MKELIHKVGMFEVVCLRYFVEGFVFGPCDQGCMFFCTIRVCYQ
jgi:hypothetical protein